MTKVRDTVLALIKAGHLDLAHELLADLSKTEQMILNTLKKKGKFGHSVGRARRGLRGKPIPYGVREAKAIDSLEKRGLVQVKRKTLKYGSGEFETTLSVTLV